MSEKRGIFDEASDDEEGNAGQGIVVNRNYARAYERRKRTEELAKARAMDDDEDSTSEEEDEDGEQLTAGIDLGIMRTIAMIRSKNKEIYDPSYSPFSGVETATEEQATESSKSADAPLRYKDMVRQQALRGRVVGDDEEEDDPMVAEAGAPSSQTYAEEQAALKRAFLEAAKADDDEEEEGRVGNDDEEAQGGGAGSESFLKLRTKTPEELAGEDSSFQAYLATQGGKAKLKAGETEVLEHFFHSPAKDENERFLRSFVLQRGWVDHDAAEFDGGGSSANSTAAEASSAMGLHADRIAQVSSENAATDASIDDDLEDVEDAASFEARYNFRFEEPGAADITSYSRTVETSVRRVDDTRKLKRERRKERKAAELSHRREELKRLKNLKMQEIRARLAAVERAAGSTHDDEDEVGGLAGFTAADLDADFDPDEWDRKMASAFGDEYYEMEDADPDFVPQKPVFDEGDLGNGEEDYEEEGALDVAEEEPMAPPSKTKDKRRKKRKRKRGKKGGDLEEEGEDNYNGIPQEEMDQVHKLDFEGVAGGVQTRFKYRKVEPEDYGLSAEEILLADDRELNSYVPLRRLAPFRMDSNWKTSSKRRKAFRQSMKERIEIERAEAEALASATAAANSGSSKKKKKKKRGKKKHAPSSDVDLGTAADSCNPVAASIQDATTAAAGVDESKEKETAEKRKKSKKKKKIKDKAAGGREGKGGLSASRLQAYGLS